MLSILHMEPLLWAGGAAAAIGSIMKWVILPTIKLVRTMIHFADATPVLMEMAEQFKPNGGPPLHEQVASMVRGQVEITDRLETVEGKIDSFVVQRKRGGNRNTDPA